VSDAPPQPHTSTSALLPIRAAGEQYHPPAFCSRLGKRSSQGRSSPVGEGALGGADGEQQQVFNDVASVCFECLRGFEGMLKVFHVVVAKADLDVAML
jgi:hypothetical protein